MQKLIRTVTAHIKRINFSVLIAREEARIGYVDFESGKVHW